MEDKHLVEYSNSNSKKTNYQNTTIKSIFERASCRAFSEKEIPNETLDRILEAGTRAPSAGNFQPFTIIKVKNHDTKQKLAKLCGKQPYISKAPVDLLFCIDWHRIDRMAEVNYAPFTASSSFKHFWVSLLDTVICAQNVTIAAESLGLGSLYIGNTLDCIRELRIIFELPKGVLPVVLLCLGYPKHKATQKKKFGINVVVHDEKYREPDDKSLDDFFENKYGDMRFKITEDRLNKLFEVCSEVHDVKYAQECIENIKKNGYINALQKNFGLFYFANLLPKGNPEFVKVIKESGFNIFEDFQPIKMDE
ncbi:MAG: nitroreductase family protein [Tepidanaerobacteraceae bacterium]